MKVPIGPDLCHGLAARRAARYLSRIYDVHLAATGLSISQFSILALIEVHPGVSIVELAHLMVMERTSLLRALKPLREGKLITDLTPGRKSALALSLSHTGKAKLRQAEPCWRAAQAEFENQVSAKRATSLRNDLLKVVFAK